MNHPDCDCPEPTESCPRYGWMMGRKHQICRGGAVAPEKRDAYLDQWTPGAVTPQMPGLLRRGGNLVSAFARHVSAGLPQATEAERAERLAACEHCELLRLPDRVCRHQTCGCFVDQKSKLRGEKCPLGKWAELPPLQSPPPPPSDRPCCPKQAAPSGPAPAAEPAAAPGPPPPVTSRFRWAYGLLAVPSRRATLLPRTLASLRNAGFGSPRLFVDGDNDAPSWEREFGLEVTCRHPRIRPHGNWVLALGELFIRDPQAERYALFQDDLLAVRNLRQYLEANPWPADAYANLYTFPVNLHLAKGRPGWFQSNQLGKGAVGLCFTREAVLGLLTTRDMVGRPLDPLRGWRGVDGGVVNSLGKLGFREHCHNPSLLYHTGETSTLDKRKPSDGTDPNHPVYTWADNLQASSFPGESFDAMGFLPRAGG